MQKEAEKLIAEYPIHGLEIAVYLLYYCTNAVSLDVRPAGLGTFSVLLSESVVFHAGAYWL
jgi:hypothetical protein